MTVGVSPVRGSAMAGGWLPTVSTMCCADAVRQHETRLPKGAEVLTVSGRTELPSGLVTFMFTDIEGSTRLARMLGDSYGTVLGAHRSCVARCAESTSAASSSSPRVTPSSSPSATPRRPSRPASRPSGRSPRYEWPSADGHARGSGWACTPAGPTRSRGEYASAEVHRAARVAAAAHGGQVLCSEATALAATTWSLALPSGAAHRPAATAPVQLQAARSRAPGCRRT